VTESTAIAIDYNPAGVYNFSRTRRKTNDHTLRPRISVALDLSHTRTLLWANGRKCIDVPDTADHTSSHPAPNPVKVRCDLCYLAYRPIMSMWFVRNSAQVQVNNSRALTDSSKTKSSELHSPHDPTILTQVSVSSFMEFILSHS
jgi:hypothetical protein